MVLLQYALSEFLEINRRENPLCGGCRSSLLVPVLTPSQSLLLIILDNLWWANFCVARVKPDLTEGTTLAQEVPALIEFDLDL
jgi:hypothetical protein